MRFSTLLSRTSLVLAALASVPALAITTQNTFNVTASIANACTVSGTTLAFGAYSPTSTTALDGTSTISVLCTVDAPYNILLNQGTVGTSVTTRQMAGPGTYKMNYELFRDASRTQNWGNTIGTDTVASTGTGTTQPFTVYGRIPAGQNLAQGSYSDTITVTVDF